jgi:hypothetical protein
MATKFHIKPDGTVAPCRATKGKCPYGGEESHYPTAEAANQAFQERMELEAKERAIAKKKQDQLVEKMKARPQKTLVSSPSFDLVTRWGTYINDSGVWSGMEVKSKGLAKDWVVEIRLDENNRSYDGEMGKHYEHSYSGAYVAYGMRMDRKKTDINEFISVLQEANETKDKIEKYLKDNEKTKTSKSKITEKSSGIQVEGHEGTWYAIDSLEDGGNKVFLLEHEEYGDETEAIVVNENGEKLFGEVYDDWHGHYEDWKEN